MLKAGKTGLAVPVFPVMASKFIAAVINRAGELGASGEDIFSGSLIRRDVLLDGERPIPTACVYEAAENAARLSGNPYLCAEVSQEYDWFSDLALPAFARHHPSLGDLIVAWLEHANQDQHSTRYRMVIEMDTATISGKRLRPTRRPTGQPDAWDVGAWVKALRDRLDRQWDNRQVTARTSDPRAIPSTMLDPASVIEGEGTEIRFPSKWLLAETSASQAARLCRDAATEPCTDLFEIFEAFDYSNFPGFESFAEFFDYEPKSLQRRLARQGTSFSELLDRARRKQAESMLRQGKLQIQEISEALGYRNPSAFNRAFTRWQGFSPKRWQSRLGD